MAKGRRRGSPLVILLLAALTLAGLVRYVRGLIRGEKPAHVMTTPSSAPMATASQNPAKPSVSIAAPAPSVNPARLSTSERWKAFRERFGEGLSGGFGRDGRLESIRGRRGESGAGRAAPGFNAADPQMAIARAREVIDAASDLLGVQSGLPLETPLAQPGPASTQVVFTERSGGVPLAPVGTVTVVLGSQGELIGLSSNYQPDVKVVNQRRLDSEAARVKAVEAVADRSSAMHPLGGAPVIWVSRPQAGGAPEGRHAYEYTVQGRRVIVDASSGEILHRRDQRHF